MTHPAAELLRAIADGKQMEETFPTKWVKCEPSRALFLIVQGRNHEVRIARPMVTRQVSYPEPLRVMPNLGGAYWYPTIDSVGTASYIDHDFDRSVFAAGMAFATEADAAEAHRALFGAQT